MIDNLPLTPHQNKEEIQSWDMFSSLDELFWKQDALYENFIVLIQQFTLRLIWLINNNYPFYFLILIKITNYKKKEIQVLV